MERERRERAGRVCRDKSELCQSTPKKTERGLVQSALPRGPRSCGTGVQREHCQLALQARPHLIVAAK